MSETASTPSVIPTLEKRSQPERIVSAMSQFMVQNDRDTIMPQQKNDWIKPDKHKERTLSMLLMRLEKVMS